MNKRISQFIFTPIMLAHHLGMCAMRELNAAYSSAHFVVHQFGQRALLLIHKCYSSHYTLEPLMATKGHSANCMLTWPNSGQMWKASSTPTFSEKHLSSSWRDAVFLVVFTLCTL